MQTTLLQPLHQIEALYTSPENTVCPSTCIKCDSIAAIKPYFDQATEKSLVVFDIDYTLRMPLEPALQMKIVRRTENLDFASQTVKEMSDAEQATFKALFCMRTQSLLVDSTIPALIKEMQERGVKVIALSSAFVGEIGSTTMEEVRYEDLKKLGIDFSTCFPQLETASFNTLSPFLGRYPTYHKGILLTNCEEVSKGDLLNAFLNSVKWEPEEVLCIDDMGNNVCAEETALQQRGIKSKTFLYSGALQYPENQIADKISHEDFKEQWMKIVNEAKTMSSHIFPKTSIESIHFDLLKI